VTWDRKYKTETKVGTAAMYPRRDAMRVPHGVKNNLSGKKKKLHGKLTSGKVPPF
jgi:hypothetical protein